MRRDQRSPEAQHYRKLYHSAAWLKIRAYQLQIEPMCRMCAEQGRVTVATVCDHIEPHRGDPAQFYAGPFQSLCKPCHDRHAQRRDEGRDIRATGLDGWPVD